MNILVAYYSGTGNTEKVANAIKEGLIGHDVDLFPVKKVNPTTLHSYDLVFFGSGIYAFNVSRKVMTLLKKAPKLPTNFAYFYTHESITPWPKAFKTVNDIIEKQNCKLLGEFECCGENLVALAKQQREALQSTLSPEERKKHEENYQKYVKGHPDAQDLENAKKFAASIIEKL
ncbi:MAG: flavodoxin family protein [Candidatus Hodarchaeota archaeon]